VNTFYWDFFGARAEPTARHFQKHLDEFLAKHELAGCETGVESAEKGHFAAFCRAPTEHQQAILGALRPQRML
jgi:hypothetical protein